MEFTAYAVAGLAFAMGAILAITGEGKHQDRLILLLFPSPIYLGAPAGGLALRFNSDNSVVAGLANMTIALSLLALVAFALMVVAVRCPELLKRVEGNAD